MQLKTVFFGVIFALSVSSTQAAGVSTFGSVSCSVLNDDMAKAQYAQGIHDGWILGAVTMYVDAKNARFPPGAKNGEVMTGVRSVCFAHPEYDLEDAVVNWVDAAITSGRAKVNQ
jgi:hypothetical protein